MSGVDCRFVNLYLQFSLNTDIWQTLGFAFADQAANTRFALDYFGKNSQKSTRNTAANPVPLDLAAKGWAMSKIGNLDPVKLEQLRQDIREGLASGAPTPWDPDEIKREGRMRRAFRLSSKSDELEPFLTRTSESLAITY